MIPPVILRSSVAIAIIRGLQFVLPAGVAIATLYVVAVASQHAFVGPLVMIAMVSGALGLAMFRPAVDRNLLLDFSPVEVSLEAAIKWVAVLGLMCLINVFTNLAEDIPNSVLAVWAALSTALIVIGNLALEKAERGSVFRRENERSTVIVGITPSSRLLASRLQNRRQYLMHLEGFFEDRTDDRVGPTGGVPVLGPIADVTAYVKRHHIKAIFIALPLRHIQRVMRLLDELQDSTVSIYYLPDIFVFDLIQSHSHDIGGVPVVAMCETPFSGYKGVFKRLTDIGFTLALLIPALPIMTLIALAIRISSPGPVIFKQRRYGLDGHEIIVYKFRSMTVTEDGAQIQQARTNDRRITRLGAFLRKTSLDELPQLFNVLEGKMSLVGPRPHAVAHNETYRQLIKGYMLRHKVLPGVTGLAQVNGCRGETSQVEQMSARVNYDLDYLRSWSPLLDLRILVRTVVQILQGDKQAR